MKIVNGNKIAYIVSAGKGLEAFIYREVDALYNRDLEIVLFLTKFKDSDIYSPKKEWKYYKFSISILLVNFLESCLKSPLRTWELLKESIRYSALPEFIIAIYYSQIMKRIDINKIHCHFGDRKFFIGYFCKHITKLPLSVTIHAHELWANPNERLFRHAIGHADKVIAIAELNKDILVSEYNVSPQKIEVIRLFVDTEIYKKTDKKRILTVGRFTERKGFDDLFKAVSLLGRQDIEVIVIGFGPLDVRKLADECGISASVVIFDKMSQEQLRVLYDLCDIYCLPSKTTEKEGKEGIPVVLMEAMAFGMPVVATDNGAVRELVKDILVEEGNPSAIAYGLQQILDNPALRKEMGEKNRKIVEKLYSKKNLDTLYDVLVEQ